MSLARAATSHPCHVDDDFPHAFAAVVLFEGAMTHKTSTAIGALLGHERPDPHQKNPLTIPVAEACRLSGLGPTTVWKFIRDGRLDVVRIAGIKRTLIVYDSLARLLTLASQSTPAPPKRGHPRKIIDAVEAP
jgi:hypothetical protein